MNISVFERWCYRIWRLTGFRHTKGLTWTFLDTKCAVGVLGSGVVLQLKRRGVVHKRLRALGHARPAVVEIGARLRRKHTTPVSCGRQADCRRRCHFLTTSTARDFHFGDILDGAAVPQLSNIHTKWERNWTTDPAPRCKRRNVFP